VSDGREGEPDGTLGKALDRRRGTGPETTWYRDEALAGPGSVHHHAQVADIEPRMCREVNPAEAQVQAKVRGSRERRARIVDRPQPGF